LINQSTVNGNPLFHTYQYLSTNI